MIKNITYKLQGAGTDNEFDSWVIEYEDENRIADIVYKDPISVEFQNETLLIEQRRKDGIKSYNKTLTNMRLMRLSSGIDHDIFKSLIYDPLATVISEINTGGWISAYSNLNATPINAMFTEDLKKQFRTDIANYIVNSGNYPEYNNNTIDENGFIIVE